jgi:hypothetical protein
MLQSPYMPVRWKLKEFLDKRNVTVYRAAKQTEGKLSRNAWYNLASDPAHVSFETLNIIIPALEELTGSPVGITDLIDYTHDN